MIVPLIAALMATGAGAPPCPVLEEEVWHRLTASEATMEPENARAAVYEEATEDSSDCPKSERIAYVRVRAVELGVGNASIDTKKGDLAQRLAQAFPKSSRIATVRARVEGSVDLARKAVSLDPSYSPAAVALAALVLSSGDAAGAQSAIDRAKNLSAVEDGYVVLARIKWAQEDVAGAIDAANRALSGRQIPIEPGGGRTVDGQAHEILGLAYLKKGEPDKAAPHLLEAQALSGRVRSILKNPDPALRKALAKARRSNKKLR